MLLLFKWTLNLNHTNIPIALIELPNDAPDDDRLELT